MVLPVSKFKRDYWEKKRLPTATQETPLLQLATPQPARYEQSVHSKFTYSDKEVSLIIQKLLLNKKAIHAFNTKRHASL